MFKVNLESMMTADMTQEDEDSIAARLEDEFIGQDVVPVEFVFTSTIRPRQRAKVEVRSFPREGLFKAIKNFGMRGKTSTRGKFFNTVNIAIGA